MVIEDELTIIEKVVILIEIPTPGAMSMRAFCRNTRQTNMKVLEEKVSGLS